MARKKVPGQHPVWTLIYKQELIREFAGNTLVRPIPFGKERAKLDRYVEKYEDQIENGFKVRGVLFEFTNAGKGSLAL